MIGSLFRKEADLWFLIASPTVWAGHFLLCYVLAAIHCSKAGSDFAALQPVRAWIVAFTAVALVIVAFASVQAWRHWGFGTDSPPHDRSTPEDRQAFLGYASLLISVLSFVAIVFTALPAFFITDCR